MTSKQIIENLLAQLSGEIGVVARERDIGPVQRRQEGVVGVVCRGWRGERGGHCNHGGRDSQGADFG